MRRTCSGKSSVPRAAGLALASCLVTGSLLALGCGGEEPRRPPPAGRQPLPSSSDRALPRPASEGSSAPMFRGPARGDIESIGRGGGLIQKMVREDRERYEREHAGPQRIAAGGDGLVLSQQIAQGLAPAAGPCEEAWQSRVAAHEAGQGPRAGTDRERREFLEACHALPAAQQSCMSPIYMQQHAEECGRVMEGPAARLRRETGMDLEHGRIPDELPSSRPRRGSGGRPSGAGAGGATDTAPGETPPPPLAPGPTAPATAPAPAAP